MSTNKKGKNKVQAKGKTKLATHDAALVTSSPGRSFWTVRVEPGGPLVLGKNLYPGTVIMKNHGPGAIMVDTGYVNDEPRLQPDQVRVMATRDKIQIATTDGKSALLEFEFMPAPR